MITLSIHAKFLPLVGLPVKLPQRDGLSKNPIDA